MDDAQSNGHPRSLPTWDPNRAKMMERGPHGTTKGGVPMLARPETTERRPVVFKNSLARGAPVPLEPEASKARKAPHGSSAPTRRKSSGSRHSPTAVVGTLVEYGPDHEEVRQLGALGLKTDQPGPGPRRAAETLAASLEYSSGGRSHSSRWGAIPGEIASIARVTGFEGRGSASCVIRQVEDFLAAPVTDPQGWHVIIPVREAESTRRGAAGCVSLIHEAAAEKTAGQQIATCAPPRRERGRRAASRYPRCYSGVCCRRASGRLRRGRRADSR